jgi:U6 snRNA-associated Sm-like protein LSm3
MIEEPIDLVRLALSERVQVKCRGDRTLTGTLHAYDAHLNMVLGNVDEECLVPKKGDSGAPSSEESSTAAVAKNSDLVKRHMDSLFVRGDGVILISTNPK